MTVESARARPRERVFRERRAAWIFPLRGTFLIDNVTGELLASGRPSNLG
jgi:hypothetical protein